MLLLPFLLDVFVLVLGCSEQGRIRRDEAGARGRRRNSGVGSLGDREGQQGLRGRQPRRRHGRPRDAGENVFKAHTTQPLLVCTQPLWYLLGEK